jgi:hypothetical protein
VTTEPTPDVIRLRWLVLLLMGLAVFGVYYAYDSVVPIADNIIEDMGISRAEYGLLFSYYSVPNLVMVLIGGILLDRFASRGHPVAEYGGTVLMDGPKQVSPVLVVPRFRGQGVARIHDVGEAHAQRTEALRLAAAGPAHHRPAGVAVVAQAVQDRARKPDCGGEIGVDVERIPVTVETVQRRLMDRDRLGRKRRCAVRPLSR